MLLSVVRKTCFVLLVACSSLGCGDVKPSGSVERKVYTSRSGIRFVFIPGGVATLGNGSLDQPFREVKVSPYWMSEAEVQDKDIAKVRPARTNTFFTGGDLPARGFSYPEILLMIEMLSQKDKLEYSLPSEAQWEYGARGGRKGAVYTWGNRVTKTLAHVDASLVSHVKSYPPNDFGLFDMLGNVQELVLEAYTDKHLDSAGVKDTVGRTKGHLRLVRGGAYHDVHAPIASRYAQPPDEHEHWFDTGFRLVMRDSEAVRKQAKIERMGG